MGIGAVPEPRFEQRCASDRAKPEPFVLSVPYARKMYAAELLEQVLARAILCDEQSCYPTAGISEMLGPMIQNLIRLWRDSLTEQFSGITDDTPLVDSAGRRCLQEADILQQMDSLGYQIRDIETAMPDPSDPEPEGAFLGRIGALQKLSRLVSSLNEVESFSVLSSAINPFLESAIQQLNDKLVLSNRSPLSGAMASPLVNSFLHELVAGAEQIVANPEGHHELKFTKSQIEVVRREAATCFRESERGLRCLAGLVAAKLMGDVTLSVEIDGRTMKDAQRCLAVEVVGADPSRLASPAEGMLTAPIMSYRPSQIVTEAREYRVEEIRTRCKSPQSLLNKLVDRMFGLHSSTPNDFSLYLKDVRGMSLIVETEEEVRNLSRMLHSLSFQDEELARFGVEPTAATRSVVTFNTRDRLSGDSPWRGIKFVLVWNGSCTEVQIKTRDFHEKERQRDTRESHRAHKDRQERERQALGESTGLGEVMSFYRALVEHVLIGSCEMPQPPSSIRLTLDQD